jgi:hypothetical protein
VTTRTPPAVGGVLRATAEAGPRDRQSGRGRRPDVAAQTPAIVRMIDPRAWGASIASSPHLPHVVASPHPHNDDRAAAGSPEWKAGVHQAPDRGDCTRALSALRVRLSKKFRSAAALAAAASPSCAATALRVAPCRRAASSNTSSSSV